MTNRLIKCLIGASGAITFTVTAFALTGHIGPINLDDPNLAYTDSSASTLATNCLSEVTNEASVEACKVNGLHTQAYPRIAQKSAKIQPASYSAADRDQRSDKVKAAK